MKYNISIKNQTFEIEVGEINQGLARVNVNGLDYDVRVENHPAMEPSAVMASNPVRLGSPIPTSVSPPPAPRTIPPQPAPENVSEGNVIKAPIPGLILEVKVKEGDPVKVGQTVIIMEAMKMENRIAAPVAGTVKEIRVHKGSEVLTGSILLIIG
jgi:glutaconyl-CoA/methylmalonyl-CoA decarboxylase subunit gamma